VIPHHGVDSIVLSNNGGSSTFLEYESEFYIAMHSLAPPNIDKCITDLLSILVPLRKMEVRFQPGETHYTRHYFEEKHPQDGVDARHLHFIVEVVAHRFIKVVLQS